ncbi:MAG: hypothetical protein K2M95_04890, partial [Clostridiales bacterium]|nr:hypothetical protein [Clostridiales bacterium]
MGILGVDFAANASSKAIKEDISLSAAITKGSGSAGTTVAADGNSATFAYNGTNTKKTKTWDTWQVKTVTIDENIGMDGTVQSVTLQPGVYKLEVWGASGGEGFGANNNNTSTFVTSVGGKGGYSYGTVTLAKTTTLYVAVGGHGSDRYWSERKTPVIGGGGGWNGGGNTISHTGSGGGGATHIALSKQGDGQLKNYASNKNDVLIVAGGGGGASFTSDKAGQSLLNGRGSAGGLVGGNGAGTYSESYKTRCRGLGAITDLTAQGGTGGGHGVQTTSSHNHTSTYSVTVGNGSFGQGGLGVGSDHGGGGGGGGWYGGGGGDINGGGGGSGFVNTKLLDAGTTFMNTCGPDVENSVGDSYSRTGNGMAKITCINPSPTQSAVPTLTLNRHESKTFTFVGTSNESSLLGVHSKAVSAADGAIYQADGLTDGNHLLTVAGHVFTNADKADAVTNSWLSHTSTANGISLKATRYWTGTKQFYVKVKDTSNATNWFKFNVQLEGGELKKDKTLPATMADDFKFGKS